MSLLKPWEKCIRWSLVGTVILAAAWGLGPLRAVGAAQGNDTARVFGKVTDESGGVIPGATMTLTSNSDGKVRTTISDETGQYQFNGLPAGEYEILAQLAGFKDTAIRLTLGSGQGKRVDVVLAVGDISETVTITSSGGQGFFMMSATRLLKNPGLTDEQRNNPDFNTESYSHIDENPFIRVSEDPRSTFAMDVDTASYSNVRRFLRDDELPPKDAVRIEELVNYFTYSHAPPRGDEPFEVSTQVAEAPWDPAHRLLAIGIQGREIAVKDRAACNLVFLLDVSGSMDEPEKLPLLKSSLRFLVDQAGARDRIAIVVYAGASGLALDSTPANRKIEVLQAIEELDAGGSTNGGEGIQLAYNIAQAHFVPGGINRVILATDGDFNVGVTNEGDLVRLIEEKAKSGVFLTVLGFGSGNLKDATMEKLADKGNGNYAYIDSELEARKVLVEELGSNLITIAKDVKIQVEFNPLEVEAYRLIGYENRLLEDRDFNDDRKDAGEIGAGHSLTVLYELVPAGEAVEAPQSDPLRYQTPSTATRAALKGELLHLKLRYKEPDGDASKLIEMPVRDDRLAFREAGEDLRFAAAVAAFGMLLRESPNKGEASYQSVLKWARDSLGTDPGGYRQDFLTLVKKADELSRVSRQDAKDAK